MIHLLFVTYYISSSFWYRTSLGGSSTHGEVLTTNKRYWLLTFPVIRAHILAFIASSSLFPFLGYFFWKGCVCVCKSWCTIYNVFWFIKSIPFFFSVMTFWIILLFVIYEYNSVSFLDEAAEPVTFALCSNLHVLIKILTCKHAFLPLKTEEWK